MDALDNRATFFIIHIEYYWHIIFQWCFYDSIRFIDIIISLSEH